MGCEVTILTHESRNNSVKGGIIIPLSFISNAQSPKVLCCLWKFICKQLERDVAQGLPMTPDVEEQSEVDYGCSMW